MGMHSVHPDSKRLLSHTVGNVPHEVPEPQLGPECGFPLCSGELGPKGTAPLHSHNSPLEALQTHLSACQYCDHMQFSLQSKVPPEERSEMVTESHLVTHPGQGSRRNTFRPCPQLHTCIVSIPWGRVKVHRGPTVPHLAPGSSGAQRMLAGIPHSCLTAPVRRGST